MHSQLLCLYFWKVSAKIVDLAKGVCIYYSGPKGQTTKIKAQQKGKTRHSFLWEKLGTCYDTDHCWLDKSVSVFLTGRNGCFTQHQVVHGSDVNMATTKEVIRDHFDELMWLPFFFFCCGSPFVICPSVYTQNILMQQHYILMSADFWSERRGCKAVKTFFQTTQVHISKGKARHAVKHFQIDLLEWDDL